jgi:hypothetical protein
MPPVNEGALQVELLALTKRLLESVAAKDWPTYESLCDATMTCFEPETKGFLVAGLDFHHTYFPASPPPSTKVTTMANAHVRILSPEAAVVAYTRLIQDGDADTQASQETRVFQKTAEKGWINVHFHRSPHAASL